MANPAYRTSVVSMAHCPATHPYQAGWYDRVPGDSILGVFGEDFERFKRNEYFQPTLRSPQQIHTCDAMPPLYHGPYHLRPGYRQVFPSYAPYRGTEEYNRQPY